MLKIKELQSGKSYKRIDFITVAKYQKKQWFFRVLTYLLMFLFVDRFYNSEPFFSYILIGFIWYEIWMVFIVQSYKEKGFKWVKTDWKKSHYEEI